MHKILIYGACLLLLLTANILFPKLSGGVPNFLFLFALMFAIRHDEDEGKGSTDFLWLAFVGGFLLDISSNSFFGTYILSFLLITMIANYVTRTFLVADPSTAYTAGLVVTANLLLIGLIYLLNSIGLRLDPGLEPLPGVYLKSKVWVDIILNLIFTWPIYLLTQFASRMVELYISRSQRP